MFDLISNPSTAFLSIESSRVDWNERLAVQMNGTDVGDKTGWDGMGCHLLVLFFRVHLFLYDQNGINSVQRSIISRWMMAAERKARLLHDSIHSALITFVKSNVALPLLPPPLLGPSSVSVLIETHFRKESKK